ncbi:MAG: Demethylmenaquinone methyltransferase [Ktedonobacterales bacterium]|jgi:demethylmenaquinone methyltransferase/2-methoxy-6-polyprenyl-1,4-benzoquinol methylase|nr:MAG: Demethylmenaquinone methyltransferase [Ktedonobacterales bacterium]
MTTTPSPAPQLRARFDAAGGKPVYVQRMFGRIAGVYDLMNRVMTGGLDGRWRRFAAQQIALGPGQTGLDIGTGTGDLAITLARVSAPSARVVGVDFTPEMLELGRKKIGKLGLAKRVELVQGDGERLDFADNSFDACCSAFVVRNLADIEHGFGEMLRVVRPGGRVVCLEMSHPYNPLFSAGFHLYFDRIIPLLGKLIGRSAEAYTYLPTSVTSFPDAPALKGIMERAGWRDVRYWYRIGGGVAIHYGVKPAR